jgi:hypothetical protein
VVERGNLHGSHSLGQVRLDACQGLALSYIPVIMMCNLGNCPSSTIDLREKEKNANNHDVEDQTPFDFFTLERL